MSKEFYISSDSTELNKAKNYFDVVDKDSRLRITMKSGALKWYAFCPDCRNKVFLEERENNPEKFFFKHHKDYIDDEVALNLCTNYFPARGKADQDQPLPIEYNNAIAEFAVANALYMYTFIDGLIGKEIFLSERYFAGYLGNMFLRGRRYKMSDMLTVSKLPFIYLCMLEEPPGVIPKEDFAVSGANLLKLSSHSPKERNEIFKNFDDISFFADHINKNITLKVLRRYTKNGEPASDCLFEKEYRMNFEFEGKAEKFRRFTLPLIFDPGLCKTEKQKKYILHLREKHLSINEVLRSFMA